MKEELKLDTYKSKSKSQLCAGVQKFRECRTSNKHEHNDAEMMLSGKSGDPKVFRWYSSHSGSMFPLPPCSSVTVGEER